MGGFLDKIEHQRSSTAELVQREPEQHGDQQHLENLSLGERIHHGVGNDIQQESRRALQLSWFGISCDGLGIERSGIHVHIGPWLHEIHDRQPDDQGDGTDNFEVEQRVAPGLANFFHVFHAGYADHDGTEYNRCDDHLDQLDEAVAQRFHRGPGFRVEVSEQHADDNRRDDLEIKRLVKRLGRRVFVHGCLRRWFVVDVCL